MDEQTQGGPKSHGLNSIGRRDALRLLGLGLSTAGLIGCSSRSSSRRLPGPDFPAIGSPDLGQSVSPVASNPQVLPFQVRSRESWTRARPNYGDMNRMSPIRHVTVHHDGMSPFTQASVMAAAGRLEIIRRAHLQRGWADIGYHFAIDRGGRSWACRPIGWQGAHVSDRNPGNVGIVVLGNFEEQRPTQSQVMALQRLLGEIRTAYRIPSRNVRSHQEWPGAKTACPGRYLQSQMNAMRS